jgi:3'-phosphoadenosine 5'-phosphosulfate sulfotransferase (PAPS reductase)/FAD synthetase
VNKTSGFIRWALERVENPYIACSFGKDSAVMLHLCLKHRPDIPVIFVRRIETDLIDNYQETIAKWGKINLHQLTVQGWIETGSKKRTVSTATNDLEYDSYFVGLRIDESAARRISIKTAGMFYKMKEGKIRICPMSDWTTNDIAAYCLSNDLPILSKYLNEGFEARTTSGIPRKFAAESLQSLKNRDIESFNKLLKLLPDARNYI